MSQLADKIKEWLTRPDLFVKEALDVTPTKQQEEALKEWGTLIRVKLKRAEGAVISGFEQPYVSKIGISIHSGHTTGKDAFAAWCILHFLICTLYPKIICTAPTDSQLRAILWSEINKWLRRSKIKDFITAQAEKIYFTEAGGKEWFAIPRTVSTNSSEDEQAETIAGFNAPFKLIVVDEASGVADAVFRPLEGGLGGKLNLVLMIGNVTKNHGFFYNSHYGTARSSNDTNSFEVTNAVAQVYTHPGEWICKRWNAEESENVNRDHVARMERKYGRDSNAFRIRVLGLPPNATPDALVPWDWLLAAVDREIDAAPDDPLAIGVDVARFGDDLSVIVAGHGPVIEEVHEYTKLDGVDIAAWTEYHVHELHKENETYGVGIDIIGVGSSVYDQLNRFTAIERLYAVNVAETASDESRFSSLRDEILWNVREEFEHGLVKIPHHTELMHEANAVKYEVLPNGKIKVESKKQMKARGMASPNYLDAYAIQRWVQKQLTRFKGYTPKVHKRKKVSWVVA